MTEIDLKHPLSIYSASAGTGKTFTLAAYYVGLLLSGVSYKNILAVTFTNKATEEMKTRIMGYLYDIAKGNANDFFKKAKTFMLPNCKNAALPDADLQAIAGKCFTEMLADYDNVHVSTIDSFLQALLSGMAQMLNQRIGFAPELDQDKLFTEAVDRLISERMQGSTANIISDYITARMDDEQNWDIRSSLIKTAKILYSETAQVFANEGKIEMDPVKIEAYRQKIAGWKSAKEFIELSRLYAEVQNEIDALPETTTNRKAVLSALEYVKQSFENPKGLKIENIFRGFTEPQAQKLQDGKWDKSLGTPLCQTLIAFHELCRECRGLYFQAKLTLKYLNDMRLMQALVDVINETLHEQNKILLAETSSILSNALKPGDADFILEKAGIRYSHIMIDEFQDTSKLQWQVFQLLLQEVLATQNQTVLIVGDIKQSIYRWRNGDWHIMAELPKNEKSNQKSLKCNFRSQEEVVKFNLETMKSIAQDPAVASVVTNIYDEGYDGTNVTEYRSQNHTGGYVRLSVCPGADKDTKKAILANMFNTMEEIMGKGIVPSDIMILVRKNDEAMDVARYFQEHKGDYQLLNKTRLVSRDSFVLKQSKSVLAIINALCYIESKDPVAGNFVERATEQEDICKALKPIDSSLPLYEMVQKVVELLFPKGDKDELKIEDVAYINCLLDNVRTYVSENGSNLQKFLQYWTDFLCNKAIPSAQTDAIQIMTVHSSKGLESKTLFIPFCSWKLTENKGEMWCKRAIDKDVYIPIEINSTAKETKDYAEYYNEECNAQIVDNLNLLYVALTRAADNLYVYVNEKITYSNGEVTGLDKNNVGYLLIKAWNLEDKVKATAQRDLNENKITDPVEITIGTLTIRPAKTSETSTFGFEQAEQLTASLHGESGQVRFRQSQEGMMHASMGHNAEEVVDRKELGTICHDLLSRIKSQTDVEPVVQSAYDKGVFENEEQKVQARKYIDKIWQTPQLSDWFNGSWKLLREQAIIVDGKERRPDRVMVRDKEAIVLDYKFGTEKAEYNKQVQEYMQTMKALGYTSVRGYLWYAEKETNEALKEVRDALKIAF